MTTKKIKRYRLGVSRYFPKTHKRAGEPTYFVEKIKHSTCKYLDLEDNRIQMCCNNCDDKFECHRDEKIHTCRKNFALWVKRMNEVHEGNAVIELFYWSEKPYRSKQVVFAKLDKDSGCGVQELYLSHLRLAHFQKAANWIIFGFLLVIIFIENTNTITCNILHIFAV